MSYQLLDLSIVRSGLIVDWSVLPVASRWTVSSPSVLSSRAPREIKFSPDWRAYKNRDRESSLKTQVNISTPQVNYFIIS